MTALAMIWALYSYHEWADLRLLDAAARAPEEELTADAGIPFGSVKGNLLHILGSQVSWVMRLTGETPQLAKIEPGRLVSALRDSYAGAHGCLRRYIGALTDDRIEGLIPLVDFEDGKPHNLERPLWEVLLSVGSHGMTHRGEVAVELTRLGASPGEIDYSEFAWRKEVREAINRTGK